MLTLTVHENVTFIFQLGVYDALTLHDNDETASRESRNNLSISSG